MAAAIARAPNNVRYFRMPMDCGIYNFRNVVRIATSEYCWLFGSDDIPAPGGLKAAVETLRRYPECSGMSSYYATYDFKMEHEQGGRLPGLYPDNMDQERQFTKFPEALSQLGPSQTFMSVQFFRRRLWSEALSVLRPAFIYTAPCHTHTFIIAQIMKLDPRWVWTPQKLIHMRSDNAENFSLHEGPTYNHSLLVLRELTGIWKEITGADRKLFRAVLRKAYRMDWSPTTIRHNKMLKGHGAHEDFEILVQFTKYLAPLPDFWYGSFLAMLVPHWVWKLSNASGVLPFLKRKLLGRG
jgi:hypothetical protein